MKSLIIVFVLLCANVLNAQTTAKPPENDNQFWNDTQLVVWSNKKNELAINGYLWIGRNFSHPVDERIGVSFTTKPSKYLSLTGGYLYRAAQPYKNSKSYENRLIGAATVNLPLKNKFKLSNRNQFEYKARNSRSNTWDYRNRLRLEREITVKNTKITPFSSVEFFYNEKTKWYRSRIAVGLHKKITEKLSGEIYYLRQNDGVSHPGDLNVIGTQLKIHL